MPENSIGVLQRDVRRVLGQMQGRRPQVSIQCYTQKNGRQHQFDTVIQASLYQQVKYLTALHGGLTEPRPGPLAERIPREFGESSMRPRSTSEPGTANDRRTIVQPGAGLSIKLTRRIPGPIEPSVTPVLDKPTSKLCERTGCAGLCTRFQ